MMLGAHYLFHTIFDIWNLFTILKINRPSISQIPDLIDQIPHSLEEMPMLAYPLRSGITNEIYIVYSSIYCA